MARRKTTKRKVTKRSQLKRTRGGHSGAGVAHPEQQCLQLPGEQDEGLVVGVPNIKGENHWVHICKDGETVVFKLLPYKGDDVGERAI